MHFLKSTLILNFGIFSHILNSCTWKINIISMCWGVFFIWNAILFDIHHKYLNLHTLNEHIYLLACKYIPFQLNSKGNGVCFKITYLTTNQNVFPTFKHNIFLIKTLVNAALNKQMFICMFGVWSQSRIFHSYGDVGNDFNFRIVYYLNKSW